MSTDIFTQTLISDGMELDPVDLSRLSARPLAQLFDQVVASALPREAFQATLDSAFDPTAVPYAFALHATGARPRQGTANNKVQIAPGTLLQAIAAADGTEPKLVPYTFAGTEEVTIANGDATNPRVDIVQMALSYVNETEARDFQDATTRALSSQTLAVRRRIQCTLSVKQGTPAASPTYPTPDAGNVVIAGVVVGATWAGGSGLVYDDTAGAVVVLHDQRMPLRVRPYGVNALGFMYDNSTSHWTVSAVSGVSVQKINDADSDDLMCPIPSAWANAGRVVGCDAALRGTAAVTTRFARWNIVTGAAVGLNGTGLVENNPVSMTGGAGLGFQALHTPAAGPTITAAANGMGAPIWTNGRRAPGLLSTGESDNTVPRDGGYLVIRAIDPPGGTVFYRFTFYVAEGL